MNTPEHPLTALEVEAQLRRLKPSVADSFHVVSAQLLFDDAQLSLWQNICFQLADAGWHGWEAAQEFIRLSASNSNSATSDAAELHPDQTARHNPEAILGVGAYCLELVGHSFEPGRNYLKGAAYCLATADLETLALVEKAGRVVALRFQQASNLQASFFSTAFNVAERENRENLAAWCELAADTCELDRKEVLSLLDLTSKAPSQEWQSLLEISKLQHGNALALLDFSLDIEHSIAAVEAELLAMTLQFSTQGQSIDVWLASLTKVLPLISDADSRVLLDVMQPLDKVSQASALAAVAEKLPLHQEWVVREWLDNRPLSGTESALLAYLSLASSVSEQYLVDLQGKVQLHEEQRALQLFVEGLCGTRLRIEVGEALPNSDGMVVRLPAEVDRYASHDENYRWLKTALVHQLGCYEFGTFELKSEGTVAAFAKHFRAFEQPMLAETIFSICEAARIDWRIAQQYKGSAKDLEIEKSTELSRRVVEAMSARRQLLEVLVQASLDFSQSVDSDTPLFVTNDLKMSARELTNYLVMLKNPAASVEDAMDVMAMCYSVISQTPIDLQPLQLVGYRGTLPFDDASINLQLTALEDMQAELSEEFEDEEMFQLKGTMDEADIDVDELEPGEVDNPTAVMTADDQLVGDDFDQVDDPTGLKQMERLREQRQEKAEVTFRYDEWDHNIQDYRRRFCTLFEFRQVEQDVDFVPAALAEHRALATRVRRQLNMLRPELLRKVKGVDDGEELDLERAIEALVDKKSGISPSEHIYVQRQRKERDVSALFLLDMSASTDDLIDPEPTVYVEQDDDYLHGFSFDKDEETKERGKTILDVEKESVVLMAEALEGLGDSYAVCGFSGYGRDRVEYYVCKDFDEPYNYQTKANIGGIKPCRSTRMGPAIRHATKMLAETESRIKALIIISDGYPQDFDYGQDRNSKDYGIKDTTKALTEASQKGIQSFCLTVDQSGHDYLREMCPDQQYMVMQDITQLPDELSKVYRGLTT